MGSGWVGAGCRARMEGQPCQTPGTVIPGAHDVPLPLSCQRPGLPNTPDKRVEAKSGRFHVGLEEALHFLLGRPSEVSDLRLRRAGGGRRADGRGRNFSPSPLLTVPRRRPRPVRLRWEAPCGSLSRPTSTCVEPVRPPLPRNRVPGVRPAAPRPGPPRSRPREGGRRSPGRLGSPAGTGVPASFPPASRWASRRGPVGVRRGAGALRGLRRTLAGYV